MGAAGDSADRERTRIRCPLTGPPLGDAASGESASTPDGNPVDDRV